MTIQLATSNVVCPNCGTINRVPISRQRDQPVCGRCKQALLPGHSIALTDQNFAQFIARMEVPVLVDFWAPWCGPCKMMAPAFEQAAQSLQGEKVLAKVNTEIAQQIAAQFRIASIPTMILFHGGREIARQSGAMSAQQIVQWALR